MFNNYKTIVGRFAVSLPARPRLLRNRGSTVKKRLRTSARLKPCPSVRGDFCKNSFRLYEHTAKKATVVK
jgi:hypothetical protein